MKALVLRAMTALAVATVVLWAPVGAQDRLKAMPGYDQYQKMSREIPASVVPGSLTVQWQPDGSAFHYVKDGRQYRYDIAKKQATPLGDAPDGAPGGRGGQGFGGQGGRGRGEGGAQPVRGRQFDS